MKEYLIAFNGGVRYKVEVDDVSILVSKKEWVSTSESYMHRYKRSSGRYLNVEMSEQEPVFRPVWSGDLSGKHIYDTLNNELRYDPRIYHFREHNTLLIDIGNNRYMHVGDELYTFKTLNGEKILQYYSPIGNSQVPYPYAVGENNTYLMLERAIIPNNSYSQTPHKDPYTVYYTTNREVNYKKFSAE
jgi:hypothetical protein